MPEPALLALTLMACFLVKHTIADYVLQTRYMFVNKGRYGHAGGLMHAGVHVLLSLPVIYILPPANPEILPLLLAGEFIVHYHIDWSKEKVNARRCLTPDNARFWNLHGLDQLLHNLTYVAMAAILILSQPTPV